LDYAVRNPDIIELEPIERMNSSCQERT